MNKTSLILFLFCYTLSSAQPFECDGDLYLTLVNSGTSVFYQIDFDESSNQTLFNPLSAGNVGLSVNAVGFRVTDNYVYGISSGHLVRIDSTGAASILVDLSDEFTPEYGNWAGDVSADGQYLYVLSTGGDPYITRQMSKINLDDFSFTTQSIPDADDLNIVCGDISFDPTDGSLYGFDFNEDRLFKIDPVTAVIDESLFPSSAVAKTMGALFFDAFGDLYGYGRGTNSDNVDTFFKLDKNTGLVTEVSIGPSAGGIDACSCPYNVELQKSVYPPSTFPCSEVVYVFKIANASALEQVGIDFLDEMPDALMITEVVRNPYGGTVLSGIGTSTLLIEGMTIPQGIDSIVIKAEVTPNALGIYRNQAQLLNLPEGFGGRTLSDDPASLIIGDSTDLEVVPLFINLELDSSSICDSDNLIIIATPSEGLSIEWEDGTSGPFQSASGEGLYRVEVSNGCETISDSIYLEDYEVQIDLGPDVTIDLGDSILLSPLIIGLSDLQWLDPLENTLSCLTCPEPYSRPFYTNTYTLSGTNEFGCYAEDDIEVRINKNRKIFIPNVFTPNFDGTNDVFYVQGKGYGLIKNFKVFDRWGAVVFESSGRQINDPAGAWDGTFRQNDLNNGVFAYFVEIEFLDGETEVYSGSITLLK